MEADKTLKVEIRFMSEGKTVVYTGFDLTKQNLLKFFTSALNDYELIKKDI